MLDTTASPALAGRGEPLGLPVLAGHFHPDCGALGSGETHRVTCARYAPGDFAYCRCCGVRQQVQGDGSIPEHPHLLNGSPCAGKDRMPLGVAE